MCLKGLIAAAFENSELLHMLKLFLCHPCIESTESLIFDRE